jgi:hypothetical protein
MANERGQATVEVVAAVSLLLLSAAVALQLLVAGHALTLADGAAEAGALALAAGQPAKQAVREALPGWARDAAEISVRGGEVRVRLQPQVALPQLAERLVVTSTAHVRQAGR